MTTLLSVPGFTSKTLFATDARDNCQQPFIALRDALDGDVLTPDQWTDQPIEAFVSWDVPPRELYQRVSWYQPSARRILIAGEPPVVRPENYDTRFHALFHAVLTWHDSLAGVGKYRKLFYPISPMSAVDDPPFDERKLLTMIVGNKSSPIEGEKYSQRRRFIRAFERMFAEQFDLYGMGWQRSEFPSFQGAATHKVDVYPRYRFALVIENQYAPGWVSEKLLDALRCNVVPIYYGAPNIARYVDPDAFIDGRRFQTVEALAVYVQQMDEADWRAYRDCADLFVGGDALTPFMPEAFAQTVVDTIGSMVPAYTFDNR